MSDSPTPNGITDVFPAIDEIGSGELRGQTVAVWEDALDRAGMTVDDLFRVPAAPGSVDPAVTLVAHVRAVTDVAVAAADAYDRHYPDGTCPLDRDHLIAASLLHDVGKVLEYEERNGEWRHSEYGGYVRHPFSGIALCDRHDVPAPVQHMIAFHSHEGDPYERTPAAMILHHADFINFDPLAE